VIDPATEPGQRLDGGATQRLGMALRKMTACAHHRFDMTRAGIEEHGKGGIGRGGFAQYLEAAPDGLLGVLVPHILQIDCDFGAGNVHTGHRPLGLANPELWS
jgi:hypothetical protein